MANLGAPKTRLYFHQAKLFEVMDYTTTAIAHWAGSHKDVFAHLKGKDIRREVLEKRWGRMLQDELSAAKILGTFKYVESIDKEVETWTKDS